MIYFWLANLVALVHGLSVLALFLGLLLALIGWLTQHPLWQRAYLLAAALTALSFVIWKTCFLTIWENWLRARFDPATTYESGFVSHYLGRLGLRVPEAAVFWTITLSITFAVLGQLFWYFYFKKESLK